MIKLSIITVNLNNYYGLQKTIESVIKQQFTNYEYLIIDGFSNDGSKELIEGFEDKISYWISELDHGIYNAMNKGIKQAKGEYCLFLNSGDWLISDKVLENVFAKNKFDADIISGNVYFFDTAKNEIKWSVCSPDNLTAKSLFYGNIPHQAAFIKRSLFEKAGLYDESLIIASDWLFFLEAFLEYGVTYQHYDGVVAYFNMEGISCNSETQNLPRVEQLQILKKKYPLFIKDYEELENLEKEKNIWENSREFIVFTYLKKIGFINFCAFIYRLKNFIKRILTKKLSND